MRELNSTANDVADDKKVPILLSIIGAKTYALLRSLFTPTAPKDKSFKYMDRISNRSQFGLPRGTIFDADAKDQTKVSLTTWPNYVD